MAAAYLTGLAGCLADVLEQADAEDLSAEAATTTAEAHAVAVDAAGAEAAQASGHLQGRTG